SPAAAASAILALRRRAPQRSLPPCGGGTGRGVATSTEFAVNASRKKAKTLCRRGRSLATPSASATTPLPVSLPQGGREPCGPDLRKSNITARSMAEPLLPHHIDQNAVG